MRRLLLSLLAATPALAFGQSAGDLIIKTANDSDLDAVNHVQCTGQPDKEVGLSDDLRARITWNLKPAEGVTFSTAGRINVYVSAERPAAGQTKESKVQSSCKTDLDGDGITYTTLLTNVGINDQVQTSDEFTLQALVAGAALACTATSDDSFWVCVSQTEGSKDLGFAVAEINLDRTAPPEPRNVTLQAGDSSLRVDCDKGEGDTTSGGAFRAKAVAVGADLPRKYSEASACSDLKIDGLVNRQQYEVTVYRLDEHHNPSEPSASVTDSPIPTDDYWDHYDGQETGGCTTAAGAAGLLGALAALATLAALRRRKS